MIPLVARWRVLCLRCLPLLLASFHASASGEEAYLIIDARVVPLEARQPTYIALKARRRFLHEPTDTSIVRIAPGEYAVSHIDFRKSVSSGIGSVFFSRDDGDNSFTVYPNAITHLGVIELERTSRGWSSQKRYDVQVKAAPELFNFACHKEPEVFARLPVRYKNEAGELKSMKVRCQNDESTD